MATGTDTIEQEKTELKEPKKWAVVLHNDDVTPMDFVVELLHYVFGLSSEEATELMLQVHFNGKGVAGVYPYEIAEQKYSEAQVLIRLSAMQLKITLEEE